MTNILKDDLLKFSIEVCSIPLDKLSIQRLIHIDSYELEGEFTDLNCFLMQDLFINANEKYTNAVLQNLSKAIQTNCGNNIDLESVNIPEDFGYGFTHINNEKEKRISKIYENYRIRPPQQDQFKIIWLKTFVQDLKKIDFIIRKIVQLPQKDYSALKPVNIFDLIEEYESFTNKFQQKIEKEFQKPIPKSEKLNFYFNEMLPDYIEKIDDYFLQFEEMRTSFKNQFGYLDSQHNYLNAIVSKAQINEISNIESFLNKVDYNDFKDLKNRFQSIVSRKRSNKNLQEKGTSIFLNELTNRVENILRDEPQPTQETPTKNESETLSDLITHKNSVEIVEKIKIQYKNIKGKSLKLLLRAFQDLDLLPKERIASKFHKACDNEFNWDIASYNAMNGHTYNDVTDKEELELKKSYLKSIIETK